MSKCEDDRILLFKYLDRSKVLINRKHQIKKEIEFHEKNTEKLLNECIELEKEIDELIIKLGKLKSHGNN